MKVKPVLWQWLDTAQVRRKVPEYAIKADWKPLYTTPQTKSLEQAKIDRLESTIYHQQGYIAYLEKQTRPTITKIDDRVVAVTLTDHEHRIAEVLWQAPKPLSDEEIWKIYGITGLGNGMALRFARAIEERHGIK